MINNDFCKIFISARSENEILNLIEHFFQSKLEKGKYLETELLDIYFLKNKEFDEQKTIHFQDNFLYFPFILEMNLLNQSAWNTYIQSIYSFLEYLNSMNITAIIACDFENLMPLSNQYSHVSP